MGADTTTMALKRIEEVVLLEAVHAYQSGNRELLEHLGVSRDAARALAAFDSEGIATFLVAGRGRVLGTAIDDTMLRNEIRLHEVASHHRRRCRRLMLLGASREVLAELGFRIGRDEYGRAALARKRKVGRPQKMTDEEAAAAQIYWNGLIEPERLEPIDHFIATCEYFSLSASTLWAYLSQHPLAGRRETGGLPVRNAWIRVMFPRWDERRVPRG